MSKDKVIKNPNKPTWGGQKWIDLNDLSTYRGALMGFAIIIVVLYHFCNRGGTDAIDNVFRAAFSQGYVGVDIFMVLSGLGLTYSLSKNENFREYYIKRWVRIFPFFTFITLIECWIIRGETFWLALLRSTTLGYWFGFPYIDWYIPALVGLYVIFPLIYRCIVKPRKYRVALAIGIICFSVGIFVSYLGWLNWKHLAFIYRIPDFLLGCMAAVAIKDGYDKIIVGRYVAASALIGVICMVFKVGGTSHFLWFANLGMTPLYLCVLCWFFRIFSQSGLGKQIVWSFGFAGMFTLEWYRISSSFERLLTNEVCPEYHFLYVIIWFLVSAALSYLAYLFFKRINDFLYRKLINIKV